MLPKQNRLRLEKDFKIVLKRGRSFFHPLFTVKSAGQALARPRIAITVSTKVSKRAVVRNRIRRVLREALRRSITHIQPCDILIMVKPSVLSVEEKTMVKSFLTFLYQIKLIKHESVVAKNK